MSSVIQTDRPWIKLYPESVPTQLDYPDVPLHRFLEDAAREHTRK